MTVNQRLYGVKCGINLFADIDKLLSVALNKLVEEVLYSVQEVLELLKAGKHFPKGGQYRQRQRNGDNRNNKLIQKLFIGHRKVVD